MAESPTFYLLYGDNPIGINEVLRQMRASMRDAGEADLNTSEFDGASVTVPEVIGAVRAMPFLCDRRLVIVRGLIEHITRKGAGTTGKKAFERLLEALPELPPHARLVLIEGQLSDNNKAVTLAQSHENGFCKAFTVPKDSTGWIRQRAQTTYGATIEPAAAHALASVTGSDLSRADNELVKLVSYVDGERAITEADVALLTPYVAEINIFEMIDALATGDGRQTLTLMHQHLNENPRDDGFSLFGLIVSQFRRLLLAREHLTSGGSARGSDLKTAIGVRTDWQAEKIGRQSRQFTVAELERIYRVLQKYDHDMKTGRITPRLALDLLVSSLSRQ